MKGTIIIFLAFIALPLFAQDEQPYTIDHTITSAAFGDERKVTIYLPPAYYRRPDAKYAVTYVLDGHYAPFIDLVEKTIEYNVNAVKVSPTIIVGIHAKNRGQEFWTPPAADAERPGRATTLIRHLREEVIPFVEEAYPEAGEYRSLVGHSSGGAFVLHTLFSEASDLFDGYLAISPGIRPGRRDILGDAAKMLSSGKPLNKFLYCSAGTVGEREDIFGRIVTRLDSIVTEHPDQGLIWEKTIFEGLDHWSVVGPSVVDGFIKQTRAFRADEKHLIDFARNEGKTMQAQIEAFYTERKATFGYVDIPSPGYLSRVAREVEWGGGAARAIELYDWALTVYPDDFYLVKERGDLKEEIGDKPGAKADLSHSLELLEDWKDRMPEKRYQALLEDLQERLAGLE